MTRIRFNPPAPLVVCSKQVKPTPDFLTLDNAHKLFLENTDRIRINNSDIRKTLVSFILAKLLEKDFSFIKNQAGLENHYQLENPNAMIETESFFSNENDDHTIKDSTNERTSNIKWNTATAT